MIMNPDIRAAFASERAAERRRAADRFRLRRQARQARVHEDSFEPIVVRQAVDADRQAIEEIAALESKPIPAGRPLLAIKGGRLEAVLDPETGEVLADPFLPTPQATRVVRAYADSELRRAA
jgi:hypothetical protein